MSHSMLSVNLPYLMYSYENKYQDKVYLSEKRLSPAQFLSSVNSGEIQFQSFAN